MAGSDTSEFLGEGQGVDAGGECGLAHRLAGGIAHFTARDLEERRRESEELSALLLASSEQRAAVAIEAGDLGGKLADAA